MYLDPGFGGMLVQVLVAIVAAGGIIVFSLRRKIRALFSTKTESETDKTTTDTGVNIPITEVEGSDDGVIDMLSDEKTTDDQ